jgi:hypothetical protein
MYLGPWLDASIAAQAPHTSVLVIVSLPCIDMWSKMVWVCNPKGYKVTQ